MTHQHDPKTLLSALDVLDRLAEFLGDSDGQTAEEVEAELIEEMGEKEYRAAKARFMAHVERLKRKLPGPD